MDEAHVMTEQASNALLKSLEEPPATSHVFLVTASPQALLPTIRSRCQTLRLGPLPAALLEAYLRDRCGLAPDEARLRAALASGSIGAALAFDAEGYRSLRDELLALLERAGKVSALERMEAPSGWPSRRTRTGPDHPARTAARRADAAPRGRAGALSTPTSVPPRRGTRGPLGERAAALAEAAGETREALRVNANKLLSMDVLMDAFAG
jgi:DNA polymerase-3 subunit delta'